MTVAVSAHQGGSEDARRATWEAYESAVTTGAEYVEFDIRRTRDGRFVVFHDPRVAGYPVSGLSYEELCAAAGHRVPLVGEVMALIAGRMKGHLDLKEVGGEDEIIRLIEQNFFYPRCWARYLRGEPSALPPLECAA